jgi:hypothetical protein
MKRRQFITLVGGAAAAWPLAASAQQSSNKIPVVGVLWHAGSAEEEEVYLSVLVKAFNDLGYVEGKNITLGDIHTAKPQYTCRASPARIQQRTRSDRAIGDCLPARKFR